MSEPVWPPRTFVSSEPEPGENTIAHSLDSEAVSWTQESAREIQDALPESLSGLHEASNVRMA
jgi:hypothetical protein